MSFFFFLQTNTSHLDTREKAHFNSDKKNDTINFATRLKITYYLFQSIFPHFINNQFHINNINNLNNSIYLKINIYIWKRINNNKNIIPQFTRAPTVKTQNISAFMKIPVHAWHMKIQLKILGREPHKN